MSDSVEPTPAKPPRRDDPLPPVQPPSAGFLLQLFVVPMAIVTVIVLVWLMFSWLAHMGSNPQQLVQDLRDLNEASWQKALTLAELLRNEDFDELKDDRAMASQLADVLEEQLDEARLEDNPIRLRVFLCRALGEFRVAEVVPVLVRAAAQQNDPREIDVRLAALEALAVYAEQNDAEWLRSNEAVWNALQRASTERADNPDQSARYDELRSTAAFTLGVVGGPQARDRLALMLSDAYVNVRYNAALGLARHGDTRAQPVVLEMLDPEKEPSEAADAHASAKASKRLMVIKNGIRGAVLLAQHSEAENPGELVEALEDLVESDLQQLDARVRRGVRINAREALIDIRKTRSRR